MRNLTMVMAAAFVVSCTAGDDDPADTAPVDSPAAAPGPDASITTPVYDTAGRKLGSLTFSDADGGIAVEGTLTGLPPGEHGMHFHTIGRCDLPKFELPGRHWNPTSRRHGSENPRGAHLGDMPNVVADSNGTAIVQAISAGVTMYGTNRLLDADGATLIIHGSRDDYRTDPSGGSGKALACAVISAGE